VTTFTNTFTASIPVEQRLAEYLKRNGMAPNYRLDETVDEIMRIVRPEAASPKVEFTLTRDSRGCSYSAPLTTTVDAGYGIARFAGFWFNREERSWVVALYEDEGCRGQIGNSQYVYTRDEAEEIAAEAVASNAPSI